MNKISLEYEAQKALELGVSRIQGAKVVTQEELLELEQQDREKSLSDDRI